jgi:methylisocitrate lyase
VPLELMAAKLREAVAARRSDDFAIIGRTNGVRASNMEDALRRAEAYREAGADVLLLSPRTAEEARFIGERLAPPLMHLVAAGGLGSSLGLTAAEMNALGFRILVDTQTPLLVAYRAWKQCYAEMAKGMDMPSMPPGAGKRLQDELHADIGLERLLQVERETVER